MEALEDTVTRAALHVAQQLYRLDPGALAAVRRMDSKTAAPLFWRLAAQNPQTIGRRDKQEDWTAIIRILAILTEKGDPAKRRPLHDPDRPLGAALCDGGSRKNWPMGSEKRGGNPRPVFSESRLMQLMSARGPQRAVLLERAARALARSREPGCGINVVDIAFTVLSPRNSRRLAETYYKRLDRAGSAAGDSTEGKD